MIIPCFRCGKVIDTPNSFNSDYIIAKDTMTKEPRDTLIALIQNPGTLTKREKIIADKTVIDEETLLELSPSEDFIRNQFNDSEYTAKRIPNIKAAEAIGKFLVKIIAEVRDQEIQKTGIICPKCHKPHDFVIWGVHRSGISSEGEN